MSGVKNSARIYLKFVHCLVQRAPQKMEMRLRQWADINQPTSLQT
jgi:hypothetical protein